MPASFYFLSISGDTLQGYLCGVEKELSFLPYLVGRKVEEDCCSYAVTIVNGIFLYIKYTPFCIHIFLLTYSNILGLDMQKLVMDM